MKKSFILYYDQFELIDELDAEQRGMLLWHLYKDSSPEDIEDKFMRLVYKSIKRSINRDNEKYENICERNRINGLRGGRPPKEPKKPTGLSGNPNNPSEPKKADSDSDSDSDKDICRRIVDHLNLKTGKEFKTKTKATKAHINARLSEGFTEEDFKTVIDNKCDKWLSDPEMSEYLRPQTLFGTKFESYLNDKPGVTTKIYETPPTRTPEEKLKKSGEKRYNPVTKKEY